MFCPQCKAEYRVGFIRCSDCDVELVGQLPADAPAPVADVPRGFEQYRFEAELQLVVVRTYESVLVADLARTTLEAAGIESVVRTDGFSRYYIGLALPQAVKLLVRAEDAEDADKILDSDATAGNDADS